MTVTVQETGGLETVLAPYTVRAVPRGGTRRRIGALSWLTLGEKARRV